MDGSYQEVWDDIYQDGYYTHYPNESIVRFIFTRLPRDLAKRRDNKVLDIGCGTGNNTWMIAKEGFDTYGFDGSRVALELNENRLKEMQLSAHLSQGDFLRLPYDSDFFHAVIDDASIETNTIGNVRSIFREVYRVLRREGIYFGRLISAESKSSMPPECEIEKGTFSETAGSFANRKRTTHFFEFEEIQALLQDAGFSNVKIEYFILGKSEEFVKFWLVEAMKL